MSFNWQMPGWPAATVNRAAIRDELAAFRKALSAARKIEHRGSRKTGGYYVKER